MARVDVHGKTEQEKLDLVASGFFELGESDDKVLEVVLSRHNLLSLLAKLHVDGSKKTIYNGDVPDGYVLKLVAEDDETHYQSGTRMGAPPVRMSSETEKVAGILDAALKEDEDKRKVVDLFHKSVSTTRGEAS